MKRKSIAIVAILLIISLISACSSSSGEMDLSKTVTSLKESGLFSQSLTQSDSTMIGGMLCLYDESVKIAYDDILEGYFYTTMGENADQIIAVKCKDEKTAENVIIAMKSYISGTKDSLEFYNPAEVSKLDGAVLYHNGIYAILAVADDGNALSGLIDKLTA